MTLTSVELLHSKTLDTNWGVYLLASSSTLVPPVKHNFLFFPVRRPHPPELLPLPTVQLTPPRPRPRLHRGRPPPTGARLWHPWRENYEKSRRRRLTSLDPQRLDALLGGCGGPAGVSHDGWHGVIASRMHPWEGGNSGEIDRVVWLAPPNFDMEFDSGTMTNTPYIICYFNGPFLSFAQGSSKL
jgi:hypothetical protein